MRRALAAVGLAILSIGWLDPFHQAREGNQLYAEGKYDAAASHYSEALVDHPDSPLVHFNLGDATYKQGKYEDALKAFIQVPTDDADSLRSARVAYNVGNAKVRLGEAAEASDPKTALTRYAEALVAYRRAMGAAPDDLDAKFNHELVEKKIADLKRKLEEQQKQKDQQQKQQQEQQPQQQPHDQQGQQDQQAQQADDKAGKDQRPETAEPQPAEGAEAPRDQPKGGEMTQQEARALLDAQRTEEVQPDEVVKRLQGAVVGEPAEDW